MNSTVTFHVNSQTAFVPRMSDNNVLSSPFTSHTDAQECQSAKVIIQGCQYLTQYFPTRNRISCPVRHTVCFNKVCFRK